MAPVHLKYAMEHSKPAQGKSHTIKVKSYVCFVLAVREHVHMTLEITLHDQFQFVS